MSDFVAVDPETGTEYPVHSRSELVNLIARGYRDGSAPKRTGKASTSAKTKAAGSPAPPESQH